MRDTRQDKSGLAAEAEKKYQAKFITMLLAIISEGVGLIISFIK